MNKLAVFAVVAVLVALVQRSFADIFFQRVPSNQKEMDEFSEIEFKCIPGRTIIKYEAPKEVEPVQESDELDARRYHMNWINYGQQKDNSCKMCVCSAEGKDEYCVRRPAINTNECLRLNDITKEYSKNIAFDHERDLSQRMRREWIWHHDEIPYEGASKCYRGMSYYTNNIKANDTTLAELESDVESFLDYENKTVCYFCICHTSGDKIACISRDPYFCDYHRMLSRDQDAVRDMYTHDFGEDRPAYFRLLSQRMRRTMDEGVYDLIDTAGASVDGACVPYVSEYTDCSKDNQCTGCTRCTCSPEATWVCKVVRDCPRDMEPVDESSVDDAFNSLLHEFQFKKDNERKPEQISTVKPEKTVLVPEADLDIEGEILSLLRDKRSPTEKDLEDDKTNNDTKLERNGTITFYHTIDELNEDTLKNSNQSGTIEVPKVDNQKSLRRADFLLKDNTTFENDLQIEPSSKQQSYNQVIDNKIDSNQTEPGTDLLEQEKIGIKANKTQKEKDKELSKIVVNELKVGTEYIGDEKAPVTSNITFTPENDTLTAMAFIAGNLLNKLWDMEKETSDEALELEAIKNEKLQDLLDLFKEPLTMRQEAFLKTALESLSRTIDKHRNTKNVNISICESINEARKFIEDAKNMSWEKSKLTMTDEALKPENKSSKPLNLNKDATAKAVSKINNVLALMKKYELVQKQLNQIKNKHGKMENEFIGKTIRLGSGDDYPIENVTETSNSSLNIFGNILKKITKLLLPSKLNKKIIHKIKNTNMLAKDDDVIKKRVKEIFNIDVGKTTLSVKDRIILDYLIKIKKNPKSLFEDNSDEGSSHAEKDILLNISEFFKMKSLLDLVKMLDLDIDSNNYQNRLKGISTSTTSTTTEVITTKNYTETVFTKQIYASTTERSAQFGNTKDRLKVHLRNILDDLVELNKETGHLGKDVDITNALPCIYNMLKSGDVFNTSGTVDPYTKLSKVFEDLKKEYQVASTSMTRRMNRKEIIDISRRIPKSAFVWERVVKNVEKQQKHNARRNMEIKAAIPVKDLLKKLEKVEAISSLNSNFNLKKTRDPTDRLMILKAFHAETQRNLDSLKDVKASLDLILSLPKELQDDITDFVNTTAKKAYFHMKVLQYIDQNKNQMKAQSNKTLKLISNSEVGKKVSKVNLLSSKPTAIQQQNNVLNKRAKQIVLTRDLVLNQLIKNRVTAYLKSIEGNIDVRNDANYNIAKSIMLNLENGNSQLAKQLYKIFTTSKVQTSKKSVNDKNLSNKVFQYKLLNEKQINKENILPDATEAAPILPMLSDILANVKRHTILDKEPIVRFQDSRRIDSASNDFLAAKRDQMLQNMLARRSLKY